MSLSHEESRHSLINLLCCFTVFSSFMSEITVTLLTCWLAPPPSFPYQKNVKWLHTHTPPPPTPPTPHPHPTPRHRCLESLDSCRKSFDFYIVFHFFYIFLFWTRRLMKQNSGDVCQSSSSYMYGLFILHHTIATFNKFEKELKLFENIVGKGENAGNQHFLFFPQCFLPYQM